MNAKLISTIVARPNPTKPRPVRWSHRPRRGSTALVRPIIRTLVADRGSDWWREQS